MAFAHDFVGIQPMGQFGLRVFAVFGACIQFHKGQNDCPTYTLGLGTEACFWMQENTRVGAYQVKLPFFGQQSAMGYAINSFLTPRCLEILFIMNMQVQNRQQNTFSNLHLWIWQQDTWICVHVIFGQSKCLTKMYICCMLCKEIPYKNTFLI